MATGELRGSRKNSELLVHAFPLSSSWGKSFLRKKGFKKNQGKQRKFIICGITWFPPNHFP